MKLVILDFETTGVDFCQDAPVEVGAILYSATYRTVLQQLSTLIPTEQNPAESINRIDATATQCVQDIVNYPLQILESWMNQEADYLVAHNADFDRHWLGWGNIIPDSDKPWLCTMTDFRWPLAGRKKSKLIDLALDHGIGVSHAHRALTDCQLIAALFDRVEGFEKLLEDAINRCESPQLLAIAKVSYDDRQLAKDQGFSWDSSTKQWRRKMSLLDYQEESLNYDFTCETIDVEAECLKAG